MSEPHQILGSLFSDIAQSIFTSDLYSRDISRYYEQDGLLRHFPVPRTEISELELNLKFAISEIELSPTQGIEREANAAAIFIDFCFAISEHISSVRVLTRVRNYKWSEVEHPGSRPWWTLNPE